MPSCLVHTGDESVTLSAATVKRLLDRGDGDAALLYLCLLRADRGVTAQELQRRLKWSQLRFMRRRRLCRSWDSSTGPRSRSPPEAGTGASGIYGG